MGTHLKKYNEFQEVELAHNVAVSAVHEYRQWRNNAFIGTQLGLARGAYVAILRQRARDALAAYKLVRTTAAAHINRHAA